MSMYVVIYCYRYWKKEKKMMKETFTTWTKSYPSVDNMWQAGFYYTGSNDEVTCIQYGIINGD